MITPPAIVSLDLTAGRLGRRVLHWEAKRLLRGAATPVVVVHDPASTTAELDWPPGTVVKPAAFCLPEGGRERINEWVFDLSRAFLAREGKELFPIVEGVSLAQLALTPVQSYWVDYAVMASALRQVVPDLGAREVHLVASDRSLVEGLAVGLEARGIRARRHVRGRTATLAQLGHGHAALRGLVGRSAAAPDGWEGLPTGGVLIVSESRPMAEMFRALEPALATRGAIPITRLQYDSGRIPPSDLPSPPVHLVSRARPEVGRPERPGEFIRFWRRHRDAIRTMSRALPEWEGGPPPLEFFIEGHVLDFLPRMADNLRFAARLLDRVRPDLLVVGNDRWWLGLAFVLLARQRGVRSISVQDGVPTETPAWFGLEADRLAASSAWLPDLLTAHGVAPDRIVITGQPRYDRLVRMAASARREDVRRTLGLDPGAWYCLVATQPLQEPAYAREVLTAIASIPDLRILLRPHPSQRHDELAAVAGSFPRDRVSFHPTDSVFDLLIASDLLVTQFSTVAIEATIIGRPVITASFGGLPEQVPYARFGLSRAASSAEELRAHVASFLEAIRRGHHDVFVPSPRGIELLVGPIDGGSTDRTAQLILDALGSAPGQAGHA